MMEVMGMAKVEIKSIKSKLLFYFIPATVIVLVAAALIVGLMARNTTTDLTENLTSEIVLASNMSVEEWLGGLKKEISNLAITNVVKSMDPDQFVPRLKEVVNQNKGLYETAFVAYPDGKAYTADWAEVELSSRVYFGKIFRDGDDFAISNALISKATGEPLFVVATAIKENNKTVGLLGLNITLNTLAEKLNAIEIGKEGFVFFSDGTGLTLSHPDPDMIMSLDMTDTKKDGFVGLEEAGIIMTKG